MAKEKNLSEKKITELKSKVKIIDKKDPDKEIEELARTIMGDDVDEISEKDELESRGWSSQNRPQAKSLTSIVRTGGDNLESTARSENSEGDRREKDEEENLPNVSYDGKRSPSSGGVNYTAGNSQGGKSGKSVYSAGSDNYMAGSSGSENYDSGRDKDRDIHGESGSDMFGERDSGISSTYSPGEIGEGKKKKKNDVY